jgi:hypothetical protein
MSAQSEPADAAQALSTALGQQKGEIAPPGLVNELARISTLLEPELATRVLGQTAQILANAIARETDPRTQAGLERDLSIVTAKLEPAQSNQILGEVAEGLAEALTHQTDARACNTLANALGNVTKSLDPVEAARVCGGCARNFLTLLEREKDAGACASLAFGLESLAMRMEPSQAARICGQASRLLSPYLEQILSTPSLTGGYDSPGPGPGPGVEWLTFVSTHLDPVEATSMLATELDRAVSNGVRHELARNLTSVAVRLEAADRERVCRQAARVLIAALRREPKVNDRCSLAEDVGTVVLRLDKHEAAQICSQAAEVLANAIAREPNANDRLSLTRALVTVSARMHPEQATGSCARTAHVLAEALDRELDRNARSWLASGLVTLAGLVDPPEVGEALVDAVVRETEDGVRSKLPSLAGRPDPAETARIYAQAARVLVIALKHEKDTHQLHQLASGLVSLINRVDPREATRICSEAFHRLVDAFARSTDKEVDGIGMMDRMMGALRLTGSDLSPTAARLDPGEAARVLATALKQGPNPSRVADLIGIFSETMDRLSDAEANRACDELVASLNLGPLEKTAPELLRHLYPERARTLAWYFASRMCSEPGADTGTLSQILAESNREQRAGRAARVASTAASGLEGMLLAAMRVSLEPFPCRLTTQELVELLKMPTCLGPARRVVLDHLGNRYGERFINHWAFVRYAKEHNLDLDFTTPPKRPDPKESIERIMKILDQPGEVH